MSKNVNAYLTTALTVVSALCLSASAPGEGVVGLQHEHHQVVSGVSDEFAELVGQWRQAKETTTKYSILLKMENLARAENPSARETLDQLLHIGQMYYKQNDYNKSLSCFSELMANSSTPPDLQIRSLRMIGQINFFSLNNNIEAEKAYSRMLDVLDQSTDNKLREMRDGFYLGEALEKLAWVYQTTEAYEKAVSVRERLITEAKINDKRRQIAYLETARDYTKMKDFERAVEIYDKLFESYPGFGKENGRIINVRMEHIDAHSYDRFDTKRIELIEKLWDDPQNAEYLTIYNVGRQLVYLKEQAGDYQGSSQIARALLAAIESRYNSITQEDIKRYNIDEAYIQAGITLGGILTNLGDLYNSALIYETLLDKYPETDFTEYVQKELELVYSKRNKIEMEGILADDNKSEQKAGKEHILQLPDPNKAQSARKVFIPNTIKAKEEQLLCILDLASGKLLPLSMRISSDPKQACEALSEIRQGDLAWNGSLIALCNANLLTIAEESHRPLLFICGERARSYDLSKNTQLPYSLLVVSSEKTPYLVTILKIESNGITIEYRQLSTSQLSQFLPTAAPGDLDVVSPS